MKLIRWLYDWVFSLARHRHAVWALAAISFIESSVFPIPPDVLLIPMVLANRQRWFMLALVCTLSSVAGAFLGYFIGAILYESVGRPIIEFYHQESNLEAMRQWYDTWGGWGVLFGAVTPFPYKVLTIFSGFVGFDLVVFTIVSIIGRGLRFFLVAALLYRFGEPIRLFIERRLGLMFTLGVVLLVGGFVAIKFVF